MPLKFFVLMLVCLAHGLVSGQEFTQVEIERLQRLGIDHDQLLIAHPDQVMELHKFLEKDRKYRTNKTAGIVLGSVGLATTIGGVLIMTKKNTENGLSRTVMGGGMAALGAVQMGFSLSLFAGANKKKKGRELIPLKWGLETN